MNLIATAVKAAERAPIPDAIALRGVDWLCARTARRLARADEAQEDAFARSMDHFPIAPQPQAANRQHYEIPESFFGLTLGPARKYSCCLYPTDIATLAQAEIAALEATCAHADLADGQRILELGCGWGSLTLHMAAAYPNAAITAVSNSLSQRAYIVAEAERRRLGNVNVLTADMNAFVPPQFDFDRIVSVEMFEHMSNWRGLLARARRWLRPDGRLLLHVFVSRTRSYRFDHDDPADWIAQHFFTGGIMPAQDLPHRFSDLYTVEAEWRWSGLHYRRTALDWLKTFDANAERIQPILRDVYGPDARLWRRRWRLFFLATAGLFSHAGGEEWRIGHYRLRPATR